ncbi:ribonuclease III [Pseudactinotalea sp. HY158]|nr:ribonuclease III [Pseudactinotalea sp. HY158]
MGRAHGAERTRRGPGEVTAAPELAAALGIELDPDLLVLALTHRSFAHEAGGIPTNERLEFLGDSVLGLIATERLYRDNPDLDEGELAKMRAASVSQHSLAAIARGLGLGGYVLLGKGELTTGGRDKDSILCDTLEAVFGAVYLCHGLEETRRVIEGLIAETLARAGRLGAGLDWKTSVQELAARRNLGAPTYEVEGSGPDHDRRYTARLLIAGQSHGAGEGTSKKAAEQRAAEAAYVSLTTPERD